MSSIGKMYVHSSKALRGKLRGEGDQLFLVVGYDAEDSSYEAWNCTLSSEGIWHPAINGKPLKTALELLDKGTNPKFLENQFKRGAPSPTTFWIDSFYKEVTPSEVDALIKWSRDNETSLKHRK